MNALYTEWSPNCNHLVILNITPLWRVTSFYTSHFSILFTAYSSPAVDSNMYRFIYSVEYLNRPPVILQDQYLLTPFDEDSPSPEYVLLICSCIYYTCYVCIAEYLLHVHMYTHMRTHTHAHTHKHTHARTHTHTQHACTHACTHTYTHIYIFHYSF